MKKERLRLWSGIIGCSLEWYDFALYGCFASIIAHLFFPSHNPANNLLATFGIFALGFLVRPLGAYFFGHFGDKISRGKMLFITVIGMSMPTVIIGLLPGYTQIGIAAPILLLIARLVQGFMVGGEYTGAALFIAEHVEPKRRGVIASIALMSTFGGVLLGSIVAMSLTTTVSQSTLYSWAWRIPFLFAFVLGIIGYYLRRLMTDSPLFIELIKTKKTLHHPAKTLFTKHWRSVLIGMGCCILPGVVEYMMFTYFPSFIHSHTNLPLDHVLYINAFSLFILISALPLFASLSDRYGRKPIILLATFLFLLFSFPIFILLTQHTWYLVLTGNILFGILIAMLAGPMPGLYIELFPTNVRYSGIAISYNIAFALFAGTTPALSTYLVNTLHSPLAPVLLIMISAIASLFFFIAMPETARKKLANF